MQVFRLCHLLSPSLSPATVVIEDMDGCRSRQQGSWHFMFGGTHSPRSVQATTRLCSFPGVQEYFASQTWEIPEKGKRELWERKQLVNVYTLADGKIIDSCFCSLRRVSNEEIFQEEMVHIERNLSRRNTNASIHSTNILYMLYSARILNLLPMLFENLMNKMNYFPRKKRTHTHKDRTGVTTSCRGPSAPSQSHRRLRALVWILGWGSHSALLPTAPTAPHSVKGALHRARSPCRHNDRAALWRMFCTSFCVDPGKCENVFFWKKNPTLGWESGVLTGF